MDQQTLTSLLIVGFFQIVVAAISAWAAVRSHRAEKAANHGNKKLAELQEQLLKMNKRVARRRQR
jgi:hypothetical protein